MSPPWRAPSPMCPSQRYPSSHPNLAKRNYCSPSLRRRGRRNRKQVHPSQRLRSQRRLMPRVPLCLTNLRPRPPLPPPQPLPQRPGRRRSGQRARDAATRARQVLGSETQAEVHQRGRQVRAHTREATRREISQKLTGQQKERAQRLPRLVQRTVARTTSPASTQYVAGARLMQVLLPHLDLGDRSLRGKGRAGAGIEPRQQNKRQLQPWARSRSPWRTSCRLRTRLLVLLRAQVRERS